MFDSTNAARDILHRAVRCANQLARTADEFLARGAESPGLLAGSEVELAKLRTLQIEMVTLAGRLHVASEALGAPGVVAEAWQAVRDAESGLDVEEADDGTV